MTQPVSVPLERIDTVRAFNRFYTQKIGVLGRGLLDSNYTLTEVRVLYEIANREHLLARDLVRDLGLDAGYLSRILGAFEKRGWLRRVRCGNDARKAFLEITPKGRKLAAELERRSRGEVAAMLASLPLEQQIKLQGHLQNVQGLFPDTTKTPTRGITLREHRAGDMGWIIYKHGLLYAQEYGWGSAFEALVAEICAAFLRNFDPKRERCWIAERDGVAVGCVMLVRHSETIGKLRLLLVDPSQRGMGVGQQLVDECLRFAREAGYRKVMLWTQSVLAAARKIYEQRRFRLVKSEPHEQFGVRLVGETWEAVLE